MVIETIEPNKWILTEGGHYGYFMYRLMKGKVSIYLAGAKINEMEVKEGEEPVMIGMIAALRDDGMHTASVKSDTEIVVDRIYLDQVRGVLKNEISKEMKDDIAAMINTIVVSNEIESLRYRLLSIPKVKLSIPEGVQSKQILEDIQKLYDRLVGTD